LKWIVKLVVEIFFDIKCIEFLGFCSKMLTTCCCTILKSNSIKLRLTMPPCVGTKFQESGRIEMNKFTCGLIKMQPTITTFLKIGNPKI
jgi:hypothetical protein